MKNKTYTVTVTHHDQVFLVPHELSERLPQPGDVYEWTQAGRTLGRDYRAGERMLVLERTGFAPHQRVSELGNLLVKGPLGISVWTAFEHSIALGFLRRVELGN
jgi:hypothetical protein